MRKIFLTIAVLFILVLTSFQIKNNDELNGKIFIGFEQDIYSHGTSPTFQTTLTFKKDSVLIVRNVISIINQDTLNFKKEEDSYQYKGIIKKQKNNIEFVAYAYKCKNCEIAVSVDEVDENGEPKDVLDYRPYKGFITKNGLKLNGRDFKPL